MGSRERNRRFRSLGLQQVISLDSENGDQSVRSLICCDPPGWRCVRTLGGCITSEVPRVRGSRFSESSSDSAQHRA
jgi:hypothetical protein